MKAQFYIIKCNRNIFYTFPFNFLVTLPVGQDHSPGTRVRWGCVGYWPISILPISVWVELVHFSCSETPVRFWVLLLLGNKIFLFGKKPCFHIICAPSPPKWGKRHQVLLRPRKQQQIDYLRVWGMLGHVWTESVPCIDLSLDKWSTVVLLFIL